MLPVARAEPPQCSGGACATWTDSIGSVEAPDRDPVGRSEQSEGIAVRDVIDRGIKCQPHLGVDLGQNQQESARKNPKKCSFLVGACFIMRRYCAKTASHPRYDICEKTNLHQNGSGGDRQPDSVFSASGEQKSGILSKLTAPSSNPRRIGRDLEIGTKRTTGTPLLVTTTSSPRSAAPTMAENLDFAWKMDSCTDRSFALVVPL